MQRYPYLTLLRYCTHHVKGGTVAGHSEITATTALVPVLTAATPNVPRLDLQSSTGGNATGSVKRSRPSTPAAQLVIRPEPCERAAGFDRQRETVGRVEAGEEVRAAARLCVAAAVSRATAAVDREQQALTTGRPTITPVLLWRGGQARIVARVARYPCAACVPSTSRQRPSGTTAAHELQAAHEAAIP